MKKRNGKIKTFLRASGVALAFFAMFAASLSVFLWAFAVRDGTAGAGADAAGMAPVSGGAAASGSEGTRASGPASVASASSGAAAEQTSGTPGGDLILVNGSHPAPKTYRPRLVTAYGFQMAEQTAAAYTKMHDAAAADGVSLWISSAYRSSERQEELFEKEIESYARTHSSPQEAEAYAAQSVAHPRCSEHVTGLALDLNGVRDDFDATPAFRWLDVHAQDYGFILRYPKDKQNVTKIKYEPWHYRFVGETAARAIKKNNLCLEEYLASLQKSGGD